MTSKVVEIERNVVPNLVGQRIKKLVEAIKVSLKDLSKGYDNDLAFIKNKLGFGEETSPKAKSIEVQLSPDRLEQFGIPDAILDRIKKECNKDYPDVCYSLVQTNIELRTLIDINKKSLSNNILALCKCRDKEAYDEKFNDYTVAEEVLKNKELLKCVTIAVLAFIIYKIDVKEDENVKELVKFIRHDYKQYRSIFPSVFFEDFGLEGYVYYDDGCNTLFIPYSEVSMLYDVMIIDSEFSEKFNHCLGQIASWSIVGKREYRDIEPPRPELCKKTKTKNEVVVYQHGKDSCLYFIF